MRTRLALVVSWFWAQGAAAMRPGDWAPDTDGTNVLMPASAVLAFVVILWAIGAKNGIARDFAEAHPAWAAAVLILGPVVVGFMFR